jgi:hypothetical protein
VSAVRDGETPKLSGKAFCLRRFDVPFDSFLTPLAERATCLPCQMCTISPGSPTHPAFAGARPASPGGERASMNAGGSAQNRQVCAHRARKRCGGREDSLALDRRNTLALHAI